mgnify:CR=1 FL=1
MSNWTTDDCSSGLHDYCTPCHCDCHGTYLTKEETLALYEILKHQYINYENPLAHQAITALYEVVKKHELGRKDSSGA